MDREVCEKAEQVGTAVSGTLKDWYTVLSVQPRMDDEGIPEVIPKDNLCILRMLLSNF